MKWFCKWRQVFKGPGSFNASLNFRGGWHVNSHEHFFVRNVFYIFGTKCNIDFFFFFLSCKIVHWQRGEIDSQFLGHLWHRTWLTRGKQQRQQRFKKPGYTCIFWLSFIEKQQHDWFSFFTASSTEVSFYFQRSRFSCWLKTPLILYHQKSKKHLMSPLNMQCLFVSLQSLLVTFFHSTKTDTPPLSPY